MIPKNHHEYIPSIIIYQEEDHFTTYQTESE